MWLSAAHRANLSCQCYLTQLRLRHFLEMSLLSTHIRNKPSKRTFTSNGQLSRTCGVRFEDVLCECCSGTAGVPWHSMHSPYGTCWASINKAMPEALKKLWHTVSTVFLPLEWVLPTFWFVTNSTLSHTPIKEDTGHLGHIPCISWILSGRVWQLHRVLSAHDQTELTVQTHFLPSRWWMHSEIQTSLLPREGWVSQKLFHWLVSLQGSSWCSKKGSGVHYTDFWNINHSRNYWLTKHLGWHHR